MESFDRVFEGYKFLFLFLKIVEYGFVLIYFKNI